MLIGLGGGLGSMLRYGSNLLLNGKQFPFSTLTVNIIGSFVIGLAFALSIKDQQFDANWKLFLTTGVCGGFTTFSAFSLENIELLQAGKYGTAMLYIVLSICFGLMATFIGYKIIQQ